MGVGLAVADDVDQARAKAARVSQAVRARVLPIRKSQ
ncbi:phosphoribosylglycinamide formyltransferase 2 [Bordetella pertussis]|nr:phosphoribosylglycinamide formyltransferase 2 [Bordetella pertussis]